jgi:glycosyltransferase involved in cell wall biosynthesis
MRIAFDGSTLTPRRTGVGYYTEHLLRSLADEVLVTGDELIVIAHRPIETTQPLPAHVQVRVGPWFPVRLGWLQVVAGRVLHELRPDVAHFTNGMVPMTLPVPTVVTIHDMSLRLYARFHPLRRVLLNRPLLAVAERRADAILTVSHSARRDLLASDRIAPDRVHVVYEAPGAQFRPLADRGRLDTVRRRLGLPERFLLYVGTIEPRKNLDRLMQAFHGARNAGVRHHLVCVGPYGWASRDLGRHIERLGLSDAVHFTGYLRSEDLTAAYNLAEFFVFPSLYEGFGLPVVEAMASGVPVITTCGSSLDEIAGGAALIVDPLDVADLQQAICRMAFEPVLRAQLSQLGLTRARDFSWQRTARETLGVYRTAAGLAARHRPVRELVAPVLPDSGAAGNVALGATKQVAVNQGATPVMRQSL